MGDPTEARKQFFFEKKNQKTFTHGACAKFNAYTKDQKFFGSFFKKELLAFLIRGKRHRGLRLGTFDKRLRRFQQYSRVHGMAPQTPGTLPMTRLPATKRVAGDLHRQLAQLPLMADRDRNGARGGTGDADDIHGPLQWGRRQDGGMMLRKR